MNRTDFPQLTAAKKQITAILRELERSTNGVVEVLDIEAVEVTRLEDSGPRFHRMVVIKLAPEPGADWSD